MIMIFVCFSLFVYSQKDMQKYLIDTREMVKVKNYKDALERFIWFHEHVLEYDKSMAGVRLSFALSDWKSLAKVYPPAMTSLIDIRDKNTNQIINNLDVAKLFQDVRAINRVLNQNSKTIELFQFLVKNKFDVAKECWPYVKDALFEAKQYDLISKLIENPLQEYSIIKERYDRNLESYKNEKIEVEHMISYDKKRFTEKCIQLIQYSHSINDPKSSTEIYDKAISVIDSDLLREALKAELNKQSGTNFLKLYHQKQVFNVMIENNAREKARLDSIASIEKAKQDSIAVIKYKSKNK